MKIKWTTIFVAMAMCSCCVTAQPDIEASLEDVVDSCASLLPAEESLTQIAAIMIDYCWAFCGYLFSWLPMLLKSLGHCFIGVSSVLNLVGEWFRMIGNSCSSLLLTGWVWELFALCGSMISSNTCDDFGRMLIEIADSSKSLEYFFRVEE